VTLFFLDCFSTAQVEAIIQRVSRGLEPKARWIFGDFALPSGGWSRLRAKIWLGVLYTFFRWQTGLPIGVLPDAEGALARVGFRSERCETFQRGLLRAAVYQR
jgi:hypothetical protein